MGNYTEEVRLGDYSSKPLSGGFVEWGGPLLEHEKKGGEG